MNEDIHKLFKYGNRKPNHTYWCSKCNVPTIQERCERCNKQGVTISKSSLRPVYKDELDIIRRQCKSKSGWLSLPDLSFWAAKRNYFYNGEKIFTGAGLTDGKPLAIKLYKDNKSLPKRQLKTETIIARLKKANQSSLNRLEYQAIEFIEQAVKTFHGRLPVVSFSGGKDSCVVSHLVRLALGSKILHIFGDTTIEYPDTYKFIEKFKMDNPIIPFLTAKPTKDFFELAEEIGPPSRILRWCCTTHKTSPIGNLMASLNGNGIIAFVGNRKAESSRRSKYNSIEFKHKIAEEILINPILSWSDTELWLYILSREIQISIGYQKGLLRAGCLYCPFNTGWSEFVTNTVYKKNITEWRDILARYATKVNHPNPETFFNDGWKVRAGGNGHKSVEYQKNHCETDSNAYNYELSTWNENFFEYIKPFGILSKIYDDGTIANYNVIDAKTNEPMFFVRISRPRKHLRVVLFVQKNKKLLLARIDGQIRRFHSCVLCGQCQNICKFKASSQNNKYSIDQIKCTNCMECVKKECIAVRAYKKTGDKKWDFSQGLSA